MAGRKAWEETPSLSKKKKVGLSTHIHSLQCGRYFPSLTASKMVRRYRALAGENELFSTFPVLPTMPKSNLSPVLALELVTPLPLANNLSWLQREQTSESDISQLEFSNTVLLPLYLVFGYFVFVYFSFTDVV